MKGMNKEGEKGGSPELMHDRLRSTASFRGVHPQRLEKPANRPHNKGRSGARDAFQSALTVISLIVMLFVPALQFQASDPDQLYRAKNITRHLTYLDMSLERNALKARAGLTNDGKTLANVRAQINQRLKQINVYSHTMQQGESKSHIRAIAMDIERMLADKQRLIETYAAKTSVGKSETAAMLAAISAIPTQHYIDALDAALSNQRDQLAQTNGIYRTLLLMLSIVLLCYVTDFLLRLKRTRNHLEKAVAELKHQKFAMDQHAIVSITNAKGEITYANDLFCEACGYSRDELIGQHKDMINSGYHSKAFYANISTMLSRGEVWHGVLSYRNKHQEHYWAHTTIVPFADSHGPEQYISISSDITDLKNAEQALQVSEIRYRSLVDAAPSAIAVHQPR